MRDVLARPERRTGVSRARKHLLSQPGRLRGAGVRLPARLRREQERRADLHLPVVQPELAERSMARRAGHGTGGAAAIPRGRHRADPARARDDLEEVRERGRVLRARLDSLAVEFADGVLSPAQIKTMTTRINEQLAEVEAVLRDAQTTRVFDGVIGAADVDAAFDALDLDRKRAVIDALLSIAVKPSGRCGRVISRDSVAWRYKRVIASALPIPLGHNRNHDGELYRSSTIE